MTGERITGPVNITYHGQKLLNLPGAVLNGLAGDELEQVMGDAEIHGYVEIPTEKSIEVSVTDREDIDLTALANKGPGTCIVEPVGGGKSYTLLDAICTRNLKLTTGKGEVPMKFIGKAWNP